MARLRLLLLFIGLLILNPSPILSADEFPIPYIYYYANTVNAIVVERADGSDSRLIAPGAMPPDHSVISDLDWSPSGQWMAWRGGVYNPYGGVVGFSAWIARADGSDRLTLLNNHDRILALEWSPTDDLIYVNYFTPELVYKFVVIDPNTNSIVAQTEYQFGMILETFPSGWIWDGSGIYFYLYLGSTKIVGELSITNQTSNRVIEPLFNNPGRILNLTNGRLLSYETVYDETPQTGIVMRDLGTEKSVLIASSGELLDKNQGFQAYWNPTMTHALILEWTCDYQAEYCSYPNPLSSRLYLLNWEAGGLQLLTTNVLVSNFERGPDKVARDQSLSDFWSPDGRYAVITDDSKNIIIVDTTTGQLFPRIELSGIQGWHWTPQANGMIIYSGSGRRLYHYDLTKWTLSPLDMPPWLASWFSPSPDGRFIGILNGYGTPDMFDMKTYSKRRWPHHSLGSSAGPIIDYEWHPDSHWFMTGEWTTFAGGGPGPSAVTVFNTAGSIRRELSVCGYLRDCAGFVPDRVLPHLGQGSPESVIQQPQFSLPHPDRVTGLTWSPDGSQIASYSGALHIWDVSAEPKLLTKYPGAITCYRQSLFCRLYWSADGRTIKLNNETIFEVWDIQADEHTVIDFSQSPFCNAYQKLSPDGLLMACVANVDNPSMSIVDTSTGLTLATIAHQWGVLSWSSDSKTLFLENDVVLWDAGEIQTLEAPMGIASADTRPTSHYLFEASYDHRIFVWDAETGEQLPDLNFYATAVALSPDGTRLAAAGSSLITIWDTAEFAQNGD